MGKLLIPLSGIPGGGFAVDTVVTVADLALGGEKGLPRDGVRVTGTLGAVSSEYLFQGTLAFVIEESCDRCLEAFALPVSVDVGWLFERGPVSDGLADLNEYEVSDGTDEDGSVHFFEGNEIDLKPPIRDEVLLAAPSKFLCREDCAGLCPACGARLNDGPCGCTPRKEARHEGFAALADMFPELGDESSEE